MALEKLLENEAAAEIERLQNEAKAKAEKIVADAQAEAQALIESRQRLLEKQHQAGLTRARSAADLELSAAKLSAQEEGIARVYEMVESSLTQIAGQPAYRDVLQRLLNEAREAIPNATVAQTAAADVNIVRMLAPDLQVEVSDTIRGGVRLLAPGGKSGVTNTLGTRLEAQRGTLTPAVRSLLNGE